MAWSDRVWILDGAMVHVSLIGFDDGTEQSIFLDGKPVSYINSDLIRQWHISRLALRQSNIGTLTI